MCEGFETKSQFVVLIKSTLNKTEMLKEGNMHATDK